MCVCVFVCVVSSVHFREQSILGIESVAKMKFVSSAVSEFSLKICFIVTLSSRLYVDEQICGMNKQNCTWRMLLLMMLMSMLILIEREVDCHPCPETACVNELNC